MSLTTQERQSIICDIRELHKIVYGSRPGSHVYSLSDEDLHSEHAFLSQQADFAIEQQDQLEKKNYIDFQNHLSNIQTICNCSKKKALCFVLDAYGLLKSKDYSFLCYYFGLDYSVAEEMKTY